MAGKVFAILGTIGLLAASVLPASAIEMKLDKPVDLGKDKAKSQVFLQKVSNTCNPNKGVDDRPECLSSVLLTITIAADHVVQGNSRTVMLDCEAGKIKYTWNPHQHEYTSFDTVPESKADYNMFLIGCAPYLNHFGAYNP